MTIVVVESAAKRSSARKRTLTIGVPTWNRARRLAVQLSLLEPHLNPNIELLVCDNGSDDGSWDALTVFCTATEKAVYCVRNGENLGADANYLRVIEAASASWLWLVGDDDDIDFATVIPRLLSTLDSTAAKVLLLLDNRESIDLPTGPRPIGIEDFFAPKNDLLGMQILQVGRVVCRADEAKKNLRAAHVGGCGLLHAYAIVYSALMAESGLAVLRVPLLEPSGDTEPSRWDLFRGHAGAWKMSLIAFSKYVQLANARENRLRQRTLLGIAIRRLVSGKRLEPTDAGWMLRVFTSRGRLTLLLMLILFAVNRRLAVAYIQWRHPRFISRQSVAAVSPDIEY